MAGEEMTIMRGSAASQLVNAAEAGFAFVYAEQARDSKKEARYQRRKWREKQDAVVEYLDSPEAEAQFDPKKLARLMKSAERAESDREAAQLDAISSLNKLGIVVAAAAAGRALVTMADGSLGVQDGDVITPLAIGFGAFMLADIVKDDDDDGRRRHDRD